jgi:hypothetical protein
LVAFPLALPMGWTQSPPYFCALTETVADVANERLRSGHRPTPHRLDALADTPTSNQTPSPAVPSIPLNPSISHTRQPISSVDVFVDDFIALAQGSPQRLQWVRRVLMDTIDDVLRPLDHADDQYRREPISESKLQKGDACWETRKTILGFVVDTISMTLELPARRQQRLSDILAQILPSQKRLSLRTWHQLLGELRSMAIAIPGARGLFSALQAAIHSKAHGRLRLTPSFHSAIDDFRWLEYSLRSRPTRLYELVPAQPSLIGSHDASGLGAGGVWFPSPGTTPRNVVVQILRDSSLVTQPLSSTSPVLWRLPFPDNVHRDLVSFSNPLGTLNNSELELAGGLLHYNVAAHCYDIRERTIKSSTDNLNTLYWERKGSISATSPAAALLRMQALHQRHHRYVPLKDYIEGPRNGMADDASRLLFLSDSQILAHFDLHYPQNEPWQLWTLPPHMSSAVISALYKRRSKPEWYLREPPPQTNIGASGQTTASDTLWILPSKGLKTPSPSSKSLRTNTDMGSSTQAKNKSALAPWKMQYVPLARRLPLWGPRTHVSPPLASTTSDSAASTIATRKPTHRQIASSQFLSPSSSTSFS